MEVCQDLVDLLLGVMNAWLESIENMPENDFTFLALGRDNLETAIWEQDHNTVSHRSRQEGRICKGDVREVWAGSGPGWKSGSVLYNVAATYVTSSTYISTYIHSRSGYNYNI
jgi:hypothetical protein